MGAFPSSPIPRLGAAGNSAPSRIPSQEIGHVERADRARLAQHEESARPTPAAHITHIALIAHLTQTTNSRGPSCDWPLPLLGAPPRRVAGTLRRAVRRNAVRLIIKEEHESAERMGVCEHVTDAVAASSVVAADLITPLLRIAPPPQGAMGAGLA